MFAVNVKGAFLLGKFAVPAIVRSGGGSFIITASANSFYAESDIAGYCATKGATMQLTRAMALDHGPDGVRVNCICPGWIDTPMSAPFLNERPESRRFGEQLAPIGAHRVRPRTSRGWRCSWPGTSRASLPGPRTTLTAAGPPGWPRP